MLSPINALCSSQAQKLIQKARSENLSKRRIWRLLLHYRASPFRLESDASSPNFFLSPQGRRNPKKEMEADIQALFGSDLKTREKTICQFPARYAWLKSKLMVQDASISCPAFETWKKKMTAPSITLVFASAYMGNPASLYGHTFLRLNNSSELMDPSISFAAQVNTKNGFLFIVDGLFGVFPGYFSTLPYSLKVEQYNDFENRDLWEYQLNLDSAAISRLLNHLWELNEVDFPYYFFNKNCSYQLLALLEVADPKTHLITHWPLYTIPADTIRAVKKAGLVKKETYEPAILTEIINLRNHLSSDEIKMIPKFIASPKQTLKTLKNLPPKKQARLLDLAAEYLQYQTDYRKKNEDASRDVRHQILSARAALGISSPPEKVPAPTPPEEGHPSARISVGQSAGSTDFTEFNWRPGLHDLLDSPKGYLPNSELAMVNLDMRRDLKTGRAYLHNLDLVHILSLSPQEPLIHKPSWNFSFGLKTADELAPKDPWNANYFGLRAGGGTSFNMPLVPWHQINYILIDADAGAGQIFRNYYRLGGGGRIGTVADLTSKWRLRLEGFAFGYFLGDTRDDIGAKIESQYDLTKSVSLRAKAERNGPDKQAGLNFLIYY